MGFGDLLDSALEYGEKAGNAANDSLRSATDDFKKSFDDYKGLRELGGLGSSISEIGSVGELGLASLGGLSKKVTAGIPAFDEAVSGALDDIGDIGNVIGDLLGGEEELTGDAARQLLETSGGLVDNFGELGSSLSDVAESVGEVAKAGLTIYNETNSLLTKVGAYKKMFGLSRMDMFDMKIPPSPSLIKKLSGNLIAAQDILETTVDLAKGAPNVADYINEKYPTLQDNMPDMGSAVEAGLPSVSDPISDVVNTVSSTLNVIDDINKFGNIFGNIASNPDKFIKDSMGQVDRALSSSISQLQTDFFNSLPSISSSVSRLLPDIQNKIAANIPNLPTAINAVNTSLPVITGAVNTIADSLPSIINSIPNYLGTMTTANITTAMVGIEAAITRTALNLEHTGGKYPSITDVVNDALPSIELILSQNIPDTPTVTNEVTITVNSMATQIGNAVNTLYTDIGNIPGVGNVFAGYDTEFVNSAVNDINTVLNTGLTVLAAKNVGDIVDIMTPQIKEQLLKSIPALPEINSVLATLDNTIATFSSTFLNDSIPTFDTTKINIDSVTNVLSTMGTSVVDNVLTMFPGLESSYTGLQSDFKFVGDLVGKIGTTISDAVPAISSVLNNVLPSIQQTLPNITAYLNDAAGPLMDKFRSNFPNFSKGAGEALTGMMNVAQGFVNANLGGLTSAASNLLKSVNFPNIPFPDISNMAIANAVKVTMGGIELVQKGMFVLQSLETAKNAMPEITAALESFENFDFKGTGFSLGMIGNYTKDIFESEKMKGIVDTVMAKFSPPSVSTKDMMVAINYANKVKSKVEGKIADAGKAIDGIKKLFA